MAHVPTNYFGRVLPAFKNKQLNISIGVTPIPHHTFQIIFSTIAGSVAKPLIYAKFGKNYIVVDVSPSH